MTDSLAREISDTETLHTAYSSGTSEEYSKDCYSVRNKYMVDSSSLLIAFVKNYRSGTGQTINYAKKTGKITDITDLSDLNLLQN